MGAQHQDAAAVARWRRALALKGMEVNGQLTRLLAAQNATLATIKLPNEDKGGEKPEERLRRFLDQIIRAQRRVGTPAFGQCAGCGEELPAAAFDDAPWIELCAPCAASEQQSGLPF